MFQELINKLQSVKKTCDVDTTILQDLVQCTVDTMIIVQKELDTKAPVHDAITMSRILLLTYFDEILIKHTKEENESNNSSPSLN